LRPSEKADHKTVLEEQGLKREVCTDGTRVKILKDITKWANDRSSASPRVFWLTGQAGSGKTTIAYTIAKRFEESGDANQHTILGGNFLCSRQFQETQAQTRIIPTIAYQLAHKCKSYADALHVTDKFDAINHDVASQMKDLLIGPWQLSEAARHAELPPYLIVIDALDEIKGDRGSAFLYNLLIAIDENDLRGLKILVTSRSDPKVAALCKSFASEAICRLQDAPIEEAKSDIEAYLKTQLPELAGSPEFAEIGQRADGLFIYAATVVKYLTPHNSITVGEQTEMLNDFLSKSYEPASSSDATGTSLVDELYQHIMYDAFSNFKGKILARRLRTLYSFLCTAERTSASIVAALVLNGDDGTARAVLRDLHAVLYTQDDQVFWYHSSFPDFIFNQERSTFHINKRDFSFSCDEPAHHGLIGESCFCIMKSGLRFNIGNITSSFLFDRNNTALSEQVNQNISAVLRYSSRYWSYHLPLPLLINTDNLRCCILEFLQIRVLFWIEAMNLLGLSNQCTPMLQFARQWVLKVCIF
jgi:NACHT domain